MSISIYIVLESDIKGLRHLKNSSLFETHSRHHCQMLPHCLILLPLHVSLLAVSLVLDIAELGQLTVELQY